MAEENNVTIAPKNNEATLTDRGLSLIARTMTGETIRFPRVMAGDGVLPEGQEPAAMTGLVNPVCEMEIRSVFTLPGTGQATVRTQLSSKTLSQFLLIREIGLFAEDPATGEEFLYGYLNFGSDKGIPIAVEDGPFPLWYAFDFNIIVGRAKVLTIEADNPLNVTSLELQAVTDAIYRDMNAREGRLQYQLDQLAEASIKRSLYHAEKQLSIGQEEAE